MIETKDYWITDDIFVFKPKFNENVDKYYHLIENYDRLIFSNYYDLNICIKKNNLYYEHYCEYYDEEQFNDEYSKFNQLISLHDSLTHLSFGRYFNQKVLLPDSLTHLIFCYYFNQLVEIPNSLTHLTFGYKFNQPIELPLNLKHLSFGVEFNQPVKLPDSLTHLNFGAFFNQEVKLPFNLTNLTLGYYFNQPVELPNSLTHLTFGYTFNRVVNLPSNLKYLKLNTNNLYLIENLANTIEELVLGPEFNLELNNLPNSIHIIRIERFSIYDKELNNLNDSIKILELPEGYDNKIKNIPRGLKKIIMSKNYAYIDDFKKYDIDLETY